MFKYESLKYDSLADLVAIAEKIDMPLSSVVLQEQAETAETTTDAMYQKMAYALEIMRDSVKDGLDPDKRSASGLTGGDAYKMMQAVKEGKNICGKVFGEALTKALAVSETNASMGRIVAAPTAGSCGILPAAILTIAEDRNIPDHDVIMALFTASAVGMVIANNASIAGAEGGCQAECGAASAMAAAAVVEMCGGTPQMCVNACAIALKNILGLVCDPVAGLVEVPCVKRNVIGAVNALSVSDMVMAGIVSKIPADQVIDAMREVGEKMDVSLKETGKGGLAKTPTAVEITKKIRENSK